MTTAFWVVIAVGVLYGLHRLATWAEARGWVHYLKGQGSSGALGSGMLELQAMLEPGKRHVVETKRAAQDGAEEDVSGEPLSPRNPRNSASIHLRPARPADLDLLRSWDEEEHVIASDPDSDWGWEEELARTPDWREQLMAEVDGRPVGFVQIIDPHREETHYWGDVAPDLRAIDIWIGDEADLGHGYGTKMMELALARCFATPSVTAVLLDPLASNTRSHRFYERLGFRKVERRLFGSDDCFVYRLEREDYVQSGLRDPARVAR